MDYTLRELECFTAVAEELSFTRAAQRLHLAQPPLSRHVRALEEKIGAPLFVRAPRRVTLTAAGAHFYQETRNALAQLTRAAEGTKRFVSGETARLRLGFVSAVLGAELLQVLRTFRQEHPGIQLAMQDLPPSEQLAALRRGELDGGFVGLLPREQHPGVQFVNWRSERVLAFVPCDHPLAARTELAVRDLAGHALVAVSADAAPAFAAFVRELCRRAGFRPQIVLESPRAQAVAVMVAAGEGIALLPESLQRVVGAGAAVLPFRNPARLTHVFARTAGTPQEAMRLFLALLRRK